MPALSNADHALAQIARHSQRLQKLRLQGFPQDDPEPLHQWRVGCRRLRTALRQFAPLLVLPDGVSPERVAALARSAGQCRDLDVMDERLRRDLLPDLPAHEREALAPVLRELGRRRRKAAEDSAAMLAGGRCHALLSRLEVWRAQPRFTALAREPLEDWLVIWLAPVWSELFLQAGWWPAAADLKALHRLRRRLKASRYALEGLEGALSGAQQAWLLTFRTAQDCLGSIQDLVVLRATLGDRRLAAFSENCPSLTQRLEREQQQLLARWSELASWWCQAATRQALIRDLGAAAATEPGADAPGPPAACQPPC